jgi:hypothetical protein
VAKKKKIERRPPPDVNQFARYLVNLSTSEERKNPSRKPRSRQAKTRTNAQ